MRIDDHLDVLRRDGKALADAAQRAGLDAVVPACPGWRVRDALLHLGGVHRWATAYVATGRCDPFTSAQEEQFFTLVGDDELIAWSRSGHAALVEALEAADPALTCWSFLPAPSPLAFWARRQAHETAIHRADVESALGLVPVWPPAFATDGVEELLRCFFARRPDKIVSEPPVSIAFTATDADTAWTIHLDAAGLRVSDGASPATLSLAGTAADLYLLLWNRIGPHGLVVSGDPAALTTWQERANVTWS